MVAPGQQHRAAGARGLGLQPPQQGHGAGDVAAALYDAANRLLSDADYDYTYDADNNMVSRTAKSGGATTTFAYDAENRLVQVASPTPSAKAARAPGSMASRTAVRASRISASWRIAPTP